MSMVACVCANPRCNKAFQAKAADRARGWAKCCSKSCAATMTNKRTGNFVRFTDRTDSNDGDEGTFQNAHQFDNCEQD